MLDANSGGEREHLSPVDTQMMKWLETKAERWQRPRCLRARLLRRQPRECPEKWRLTSARLQCCDHAPSVE